MGRGHVCGSLQSASSGMFTRLDEYKYENKNGGSFFFEDDLNIIVVE